MSLIDESLLPTDDDVAFYEEHGYWIGPKVLDDAFLDRLRLAMYQVYAAEFETGKEPWGGPWVLGDNRLAVRKMDQAHWANNTFRELVTHATIGAIAARLARTPEVRLWHDQLLYKPGQGPNAKAGGNVGWHQDRNYWQCTTDNLLTAWVAFDDVTVQNGCMLAVPGSHKWGLIEGNFFEQDLEAFKTKIVRELGHEWKTVPLEIPAGALSFHHCLTIHGSGPNFTHKPRRSLVLHLMPDDAHYVAGTPNDNHMNAILMRERGGRDGDRFAGDLWPVLYSEKTPAAV